MPPGERADRAALADFDFRQATAAVWAIADEANRYINRVRPWELAKAENDGDTEAGHRLDAVLGALFAACSKLGRELAPFLPDAAARIVSQCTPREGRLPEACPVFRRLASPDRALSGGGGPARGRTSGTGAAPRTRR